MANILIIDTNQELINQIKKNVTFPSYHNVTVISDTIDNHITDKSVIVTASNPSFSAGGGLDMHLANKYPETWAKAQQGRIDNLFFATTVDSNFKSSYELVFKAISDSHQSITDDETLIITGLGTGIGGLSYNLFCRALENGCRSFGNAQVYDSARVYGNALVYGNARVTGNARVYGNTEVYGNAHVSGNARVLTGHINFGSSGGDDIIMSIAHQLGLYPDNDGFYILYKRINSDLSSLYDHKFIYPKSGIVEVEAEISHNSCTTGLHFSSLFYWNKGDIYLQAKIHIDDIITCQEGKVRCSKALILGVVDFNKKF